MVSFMGCIYLLWLIEFAVYNVRNFPYNLHKISTIHRLESNETEGYPLLDSRLI